MPEETYTVPLGYDESNFEDLEAEIQRSGYEIKSVSESVFNEIREISPAAEGFLENDVPDIFPRFFKFADLCWYAGTKPIEWGIKAVAIPSVIGYRKMDEGSMDEKSRLRVFHPETYQDSRPHWKLSYHESSEGREVKLAGSGGEGFEDLETVVERHLSDHEI